VGVQEVNRHRGRDTPAPARPISGRPPGVAAHEKTYSWDRSTNTPTREALTRAGRNPIVDEREEVVTDDKLLLRIEEAAKRLGIGRSLMYRLVLSGEVQSVPLGRLRRIPAEALREYVERLRVEASGKSPAA
jgi:excisionase family DNA binding protein